MREGGYRKGPSPRDGGCDDRIFRHRSQPVGRKDLSADLRGIRAPTGFDGRASDQTVLRQKGHPLRGVPFLLFPLRRHV
jgi:hypothetical protein